MPCDPILFPACLVIGGAQSAAQSAISSAAGDVLSGIAAAIEAGIRWIVVNTATWWVQSPSPNLAGEPAVGAIQRWLLPVTAAVAIGAVIAAGARMAITRRANPLLDVTGGLMTLAAATALGTIVPALLLRAGDAWTTWILQVSTGGQFTQRLELVLNLGGTAAPAVVIVFGIAAIILSLVQAVLMLFRQTALIILAGVLPLAAAGSIAPLTRPWFKKITAWMLALICYKPAAAAVYATAFTMFGSGGPRTAVMGFVMLAMSIVALPALLRFFTWTTGTIASSGGGGQLLGGAAMGLVAMGAMRSGGSRAQDQAAYLDSRLGPPPGGEAALPAGTGSAGPAGPGAAGDRAGGSGTGAGGRTGASPPGSAPGPGGAAGGAGGAPLPARGAAAAGAPGAVSGVAVAPSANAGSAGSGVAASGAAAAGPVLAAAEAARLAAEAARQAAGAMEPGEQP